MVTGNNEAKPLQALAVFKALVIEREHLNDAEARAENLADTRESRTAWVALADSHADQIARLRRFLFTTMVVSHTGELFWSGYAARLEYSNEADTLGLRIEKVRET